MLLVPPLFNRKAPFWMRADQCFCTCAPLLAVGERKKNLSMKRNPPSSVPTNLSHCQKTPNGQSPNSVVSTCAKIVSWYASIYFAVGRSRLLLKFPVTFFRVVQTKNLCNDSSANGFTDGFCAGAISFLCLVCFCVKSRKDCTNFDFIRVDKNVRINLGLFQSDCGT